MAAPRRPSLLPGAKQPRRRLLGRGNGEAAAGSGTASRQQLLNDDLILQPSRLTGRRRRPSTRVPCSDSPAKLAAQLELRPCEHQVAGHLFENGKAGSLVDDRGHFYKPLQLGPRGDRERAFYDAIAATLRAEEAAAAAAVAEAQERKAAELRLGRHASSPIAVKNGSATGAVAAEWAAAAEHASSAASDGSGLAAEAAPPPLPWRRRQLMQTFPSYKECRRERGPMHIMQRDELGLLPIRTAAAQLGTSLPDDLQLHKQRRRQPQAGEPPLPPLASRSQPQHQEASSQRRRPRSWSGSPPVADGALAQHVEQYGKSPDSDDCAELTGRHLMQIVHPECPASPSTAGTPTPGKGGQQQQQDEQQQPQQAGAAAPASPRLREHRHTTEHAEEAYTLPEHAQAAALLGQPVYDRSLNVGPVVVGGGSGLPHPSPFSASPPQHDHLSSLFQAQQQQQPRQQGQEQQQQQEQPGVSSLLAGGRCTSLPLAVPASPRGAGAAAALADGLAQLSGLGSPAGSVTGGALAASCAAHWLQDEEAAAEALRREVATHGRSVFASLPFSVRNAPLLRVIPKYYGVAQHFDGRTLLELEDLARAYHRPCIMDIKVGFRTWYPAADNAYIQRCKDKDDSTTQAALGFKICGMQVFRHGAGGYWRASKRWCKTLPVELVDKALLSFAHNEHGLRPADVYGGGGGGAIAQLEALEAWFAVQRDFHFYSSSVLLLYEGGATSQEEAKVRVRLVDFAHTFQAEGGARDTNFLAGLRALLARLRAVVHAQLQQELT